MDQSDGGALLAALLGFQTENRVDVSRLSRTCRTLRAMVEPILYERITVASMQMNPAFFDPASARQRLSGNVLDALLRTLRARGPSLARHIRTLSLEEAGPETVPLVKLCSNLRALHATHPASIAAVPDLATLEELEVNEAEGVRRENPFRSIEWFGLSGLHKLVLTLCARDFADGVACRRVAPVFADMPLRTLELRPSFEDILVGNPPALDIVTLFKTLVGKDVQRVVADQLEILPRGVIPAGVGASLTWLYLGPGSSSCDYSKLPQLRELHVSEDDGEIVFPARMRLPAALRVLAVHSGDAALDINVQVIEEVERLILAEQSVPVCNVIIHKYYASDRVMVVVLHSMCTARNVKMNIAKETKFPWRAWIRIECKLSGLKIYTPAHCHFRGERVAPRMSTEEVKSQCRPMCTPNVRRLRAEGTNSEQVSHV
jgi:hypothetical protein